MVIKKANTRGTVTDLVPQLKPLTPQEQCKIDGGYWDPITQTCISAPKVEGPVSKPKGPKTVISQEEATSRVSNPPKTPEVFKTQTGENSGITLPDGNTFLGLNPSDISSIAEERVQKTSLPAGTQLAGSAATQQSFQASNQQLAGQVGQIQSSTGITPTGIDYGEAAIQGAVGSIPSAIRTGALVGGAALAGAGAGAAAGTAITPVIGTAIGAAVGLVAGITAGIISNAKSQRSDTTTAQQRVLDEGKQTLKDWTTMAKADPANREKYLGEFNKQLQLIQNAHVQMITDTNADVAKFETALPNLAEFEAFYSVGGERDALVNEMRIALQTPVSTDYSMMELANRYQ